MSQIQHQFTALHCTISQDASRQDAECCALGMPALSQCQLCHQDGSVVALLRADLTLLLPRGPSHCQGTVLALPWAQPLGKGTNREDSFHPLILSHGCDRGRRSLYCSYIFLYLWQQSFLKAFSFLSSISFAIILFASFHFVFLLQQHRPR